MNFIKNHTRLLLKIFGIGFLVLSLGYLGIKSPEIHTAFIRSTVGSKVVTIRGKRGGGTGFHVQARSGKIYILTNAHICALQESGNVNVRLEGSSRYIPRRVIEVFAKHDLCLVEPVVGVGGVGLSNGVGFGEVIGLIGHPRLTPLTLTKGQFLGYTNIELLEKKNVTQSECNGRFIEISDPLLQLLIGAKSFCFRTLNAGHISNTTYPGNSGSPVVNFYGNLVGVLFAGNSRAITEGYIVPIKFIKEFLELH